MEVKSVVGRRYSIAVGVATRKYSFNKDFFDTVQFQIFRILRGFQLAGCIRDMYWILGSDYGLTESLNKSWKYLCLSRTLRCARMGPSKD